MHLTVNVKRDGHGHGLNHMGPGNHMNQNGHGNLLSHNAQGISMSNQGLCNSNNVGNSVGNSSLNYASSGPSNTMNNAYGNQGNGFGDSRYAGFNNAPGWVDRIHRPWRDGDPSNSYPILPARETGVIESPQVSTFYFVFPTF